MSKLLRNAALVAAALTLSVASATSVKGADGVTVNVNNPKRVVALNGTTVEIIYALGKGNTIVARDNSGVYPAEAAQLPDLGHWAKLGAEGILSLKPDLVIATEDTFVNPDSALKTQLRGAGVPLLVLPAAGRNGTGGFRQRVNMVAEAYGVPNDGAQYMRKFVHDLAKTHNLKPTQRPKAVFLYAHGPNDSTIYGTRNGADTLIRLAGGTNVATSPTNQKLTAEAMVKLNPDVIIMLDRGMQAVGGEAGLLKMPGVAQTAAGKNRHFYVVDDSVRWVGPRLPEFVKKLATQWKADLN